MALVTGASAGIGWATCELLAEAGMRVVAIARRRERLEALQQHLVSRGVPIADFLPVVCDITKVYSSSSNSAASMTPCTSPELVCTSSRCGCFAGTQALLAALAERPPAISPVRRCRPGLSPCAQKACLTGRACLQEAEVVALPRIIVKRWPGAGIDVLVNNAGLGRNNAGLWDGSTASWVEMISTNVLGVCMCTREALKVSLERQLTLSGLHPTCTSLQLTFGLSLFICAGRDVLTDHLGFLCRRAE